MSSKIGTTTNLGKFLEEWTLQENSDGGAAINLVATSQTQLTKAETGVTKVYTAFGITPSPTFNTNTAFVPVQAFAIGAQESEQYYFHPDHLGSSNYITNVAGDVSQHMEYFAFGETFVEEHKNSINSPFKFNCKELDEESGLYYYSARYYDPRLSIWASVDPLANFNPFMDDEHYIDGDHNGGVFFHGNLNPYIYCYQNSIKFIDPNGKQNIAAGLTGGAKNVLISLTEQFFADVVKYYYKNDTLTGYDFSKAEIDKGDLGLEFAKGFAEGASPIGLFKSLGDLIAVSQIGYDAFKDAKIGFTEDKTLGQISMVDMFKSKNGKHLKTFVNSVIFGTFNEYVLGEKQDEFYKTFGKKNADKIFKYITEKVSDFVFDTIKQTSAKLSGGISEIKTESETREQAKVELKKK